MGSELAGRRTNAADQLDTARQGEDARGLVALSHDGCKCAEVVELGAGWSLGGGGAHRGCLTLLRPSSSLPSSSSSYSAAEE